MVKVSNVAQIINGDRSSNYPSGGDFRVSGVPFINAGHLKDGSIDYSSMDYITREKYNQLSGAKIQRDDILLCLRGSLGKYALATTDGGAPASSIAVIRPNTEMVNPLYLLQIISSSIFQKQIEMENNGSSQPNLSAKSVSDFTIPLPALEEQQNIAAALCDMDNLLSLLKKQIFKKKAIKQGVMQELLTGKRRLPGFSGEWLEYRLGTLGVFLKGSGISRTESNSGNIPAVRYGELYTKHQNYIAKYFSHISKEVAVNAKQVYSGDILFAASGETKEEIGKCAAIIDEEPVYAGGDILIFRPTAQLDPVFMGTLLNTTDVCKQRAEKGQGDAIVHIHADALGSIRITIPDIEEQQAISEVLVGMDKEIELLAQKLAKYRQVKQGMMQQLLTGKIRLV